MPVLDVFTHILPPRYLTALRTKAPAEFLRVSVEPEVGVSPTVTDVSLRLRALESYDDYSTILTMAVPPVEMAVGPRDAVELSKMANDEMADLVAEHPERFRAAVACLPMNDIDGALDEIDRCIKTLGFCGVLMYTHISGKALDRPEFFPIYEKMVQYDLPIWIHPVWNRVEPTYTEESPASYLLTSMFGLPFETTAAMTHLVFSGVMQAFPTLKIVTHHCGAMVPFFRQRIVGGFDYQSKIFNGRFGAALDFDKPPIEYFKRFFADTAVYGSTPSLMCGYEFFGPDHILFGTDFPFDNEGGHRWIRETLQSVEDMDIPRHDKEKILYGNAVELLKLDR